MAGPGNPERHPGGGSHRRLTEGPPALQPTGEWLNQPGGLTERLVRLRRAAGLSGDQLAARLAWARSKVPKLENGRQMPTEADLTAWAEACGQPEAAPELLR